MENKYLIYESAITAPIEQPKRNGNIVEFITVLQEADRKNRNGRIYPKEVIDAALHSPLVQEHLRHKTLVGECGHPFSQDLARQTNVDMRNAAFRVDEFWWEGNLLKGRCRTLDTAVGRDMAGMIMDGCELSFSMRGQGNVIRDASRDALVVQPPLMLICWDWVWTPSHDVAYMEKICEETKDSLFSRTPAMSLMESMEIYENGALTEINGTVKEEKPFIDYCETYGRTFKSLNETYRYNPADVVKEINDKYVILENDTSIMKVAKNDYLLKSIRIGLNEAIDPGTVATVAKTGIDACKNIKKADDAIGTVSKAMGKPLKETCAGVAALDCPRSTEPLEAEDKAAPEIESKDVLQTLNSSPDVEYQNPVEAEVKKELGSEAKNVSADIVKEDEDLSELFNVQVNRTKHRVIASDNAEVETGEHEASKTKDSNVKVRDHEVGDIEGGMNADGVRLMDLNMDNADVNVMGGSARRKKPAVKSSAPKQLKKKASAPKASEPKQLAMKEDIEINELLNFKINTTETETVADKNAKIKTGKLHASETEDNHNKAVKTKTGKIKANYDFDDARLLDINADGANVNVMGGGVSNSGVDKKKMSAKEKKALLLKAKNEAPKQIASKDLKEEFYKYYKLIAEETGLTEAIDIIKLGAKYGEFMSEDCANLFADLAERGE